MTPARKTSESLAKPAARVLNLVENVVYSLAGLLLVSAAIAVLGAVGYRLVRDLGGGIDDAITTALDGLLLVFILLELLAGVRATMVERKLVAEPFLIVGIIASIKEIVVLALEADANGSQQAFDNTMVEIGLLSGVVVLLAVASFLVRRKEREPSEE